METLRDKINLGLHVNLRSLCDPTKNCKVVRINIEDLNKLLSLKEGDSFRFMVKEDRKFVFANAYICGSGCQVTYKDVQYWLA